MSSIRVKRARAPLAYVPVQQGQVVVVPTEKLPSPQNPNAPENHEFLQEHAQEIVRAPQASAPSGTQAIPDQDRQTRRRSKTLGALESGDGSGASNIHFRPPPLERPQRRLRSGSGSWFMDHVANSSVGPRPVLQTIPSQATPAPLVRGPSSVASNTTLEVVIPEEARAGLAETLQNQSPSVTSLEDELHPDDIVDHLSVIDAHIATVSHLSNAANSILIPPLSFYSRRPTITMPTQPIAVEASSIKGDNHALDQHVEDVLRRRDKFRRTMQGVWAYLKTPVGVLTGIYGFLVVFWGAALVLFLVKWINFHNSYLQGFWIEVASQIENALFTIQGVGFLPWRIMDTWNIGWIYYFKRRTHRRRRLANLPPLGDENDLPDPLVHSIEVQVLEDRELRKLRYHQARFMHSQTWYRPHGTATHKAFSIQVALWICIFVDLNSVFQIILCGCMWGLNRFNRPAWTTGSLIPLSFICGIVAGILIWKGGEMSKKTAEVEERLRQALDKEKLVLQERYGRPDPDSVTLQNGIVAESPIETKVPMETRSWVEEAERPTPYPASQAIPVGEDDRRSVRKSKSSDQRPASKRHSSQTSSPPRRTRSPLEDDEQPLVETSKPPSTRLPTPPKHHIYRPDADQLV